MLGVLHSLKDAGVPSMLVSTSPRPIVENVMRQSEGLFAGYVCGDDPVAHKPDPAPYLEAASRLGLSADDMPHCVVFEDSSSGPAFGCGVGCHRDRADRLDPHRYLRLGQFLSIDSYDGIDAAALDVIVRRRLATR